MSSLPPPPVPADADLRHFQSMPVDVDRLRRSKAWLICRRRPELGFHMFNLWGRAWREVPAGSLEDDDDVLADAAMCSPDRWPKIRTEAMRGWTKFADNRLYHRTVCEKVIEALNATRLHRFNRAHARQRKDNVERKKKGLALLAYPERPVGLVLQWPERSGEPNGTFPDTFQSRGFSPEGKGRESFPKDVPSGRSLGNVPETSTPIATHGGLEGPARDGVQAAVDRLANIVRVSA
jgi:hypothetical protein